MGGFKKSVYVFLSSLLGVMLFLVLDRIIVLSYLLLVTTGVAPWHSVYSYLEFLAVDYITLLLAMLCGSWYGIWLGTYWYERVYEQGSWHGVFYSLRHALSPDRTKSWELKRKVETVRGKLEEDLEQVEDLVEELPSRQAEPAAVQPVATEPVVLAVPKKRPVRKKSVSRARKTKSGKLNVTGF